MSNTKFDKFHCIYPVNSVTVIFIAILWTFSVIHRWPDYQTSFSWFLHRFLCCSLQDITDFSTLSVESMVEDELSKTQHLQTHCD